jgi:hypothetical protein
LIGTITKIALISAPFYFLSSCNSCKKDKDKDSGDSTGIVSIPQGGGQEQPTPTPDPGPPVLKLAGLPPDPANIDILNIIVTTESGNPAAFFRYALLTDQESCVDARYSGYQDILEPLVADVGADGRKLLCVQGKTEFEQVQPDPTTYSWVNDLTAPTATLTAYPGLGPGTTQGDGTDFFGTAADNASGLKAVRFSVQKGSSLLGCLNTELSAFISKCPNWIDVEPDGDTLASYSFSLADNIFSHGVQYSFNVTAIDNVDNELASPALLVLTWDTVPPPAPWYLNVTSSSGRLLLDWPEIDDAAGYLLVRKKESAVTFKPTIGTNYLAGNFVAENEQIVYWGELTSVVDDGLLPNVKYYYSIFSYDGARNFSNAQTSSATTKATFLGLADSVVLGPNHHITVKWQPLDNGIDDVSTIDYDLFSSNLPGSQDFDANPSQTTQGGSGLTFESPDSAISLVLRVDGDSVADTNTREKTLSLSGGVHHKVLNQRLYNGMVSPQAFLNNPYGLTVDNWGNALFILNDEGAFSNATGIIFVRCQETQEAPYCRGRAIDKVYAIAGSDGIGTASNESYSFQPLGILTALTVDRNGNVFAADSTSKVIIALCNYVGTNAGFCAQKVVGKVYTVTNGGAGTPTDGAPVTDLELSNVYGIGFDPYLNMFIANYDHYGVFALCFTASAGYCLNKTVDVAHSVVGDGAASDSDNGPASSTKIGRPRDIAIDGYGNIGIADETYKRIRIVCNVAQGPFCSGKFSNYIYRVAGDGSTDSANDGDSLDPAVPIAIGTPKSLIFDSFGNILASDTSHKVIRAFCKSQVSNGGLCKNRTIGTLGNHYIVGGIKDNEGSDFGNLAVASKIGLIYDLASDAYNNLYLADYSQLSVKIICSEVESIGSCYGKQQEYIYLLAGSGQLISEVSTTGDLAKFPNIGKIKSFASDGDGNLYFINDAGNRAFAICYNATSLGFCNGKPTGNVLKLVGNGTPGSPSDGATIANSTPINGMKLIAVDSTGNLFISKDFSGQSRLYGLCFQVATGICQDTSGYVGGAPPGIHALEKFPNKIYTLVGGGTGKLGDGDYAYEKVFNFIKALDFDSNDNLYIVGEDTNQTDDFFSIGWLICGSELGNCQGTVEPVGVAEKFVGGATTVEPSNVTPSTLGTQLELDVREVVIKAIGISTHGNPYIAISGDEITSTLEINAVFIICMQSSESLCSGKTNKEIVTFAGANGTPSVDIDSGVTLRTAAIFGDLHGIALDAQNNVLLADKMTFSGNMARIRLVCNSTSEWCNGKTSARVYTLAGTGTVFGDGPSNIAAAIQIGDSQDSPSLQTANSSSLFYLDQTFSTIRMFIP